MVDHSTIFELAQEKEQKHSSSTPFSFEVAATPVLSNALTCATPETKLFMLVYLAMSCMLFMRILKVRFSRRCRHTVQPKQKFGSLPSNHPPSPPSDLSIEARRAEKHAVRGASWAA